MGHNTRDDRAGPARPILQALYDRARTGVNNLRGNLPAARKTQEQDRSRHVFRLRYAMKEILQRAARRDI